MSEIVTMTIDEIVQRCKTALEKHYGAELTGVILYGSAARTQANTLSDIDLLVLLNKPFDYFVELRRIIDLLYPIQLESTHLISARPVLVEDFEAGAIQLYRNARREGIAV